MYIHANRKPRSKDRNRSARFRAKIKSHQRRRVNRMAGRRLSGRRASFKGKR